MVVLLSNLEARKTHTVFSIQKDESVVNSKNPKQKQQE